MISTAQKEQTFNLCKCNFLPSNVGSNISHWSLRRECTFAHSLHDAPPFYEYRFSTDTFFVYQLFILFPLNIYASINFNISLIIYWIELLSSLAWHFQNWIYLMNSIYNVMRQFSWNVYLRNRQRWLQQRLSLSFFWHGTTSNGTISWKQKKNK